MGPTAIFDKSALQALSVDESVWFEAFFLPNLVPVFYVETLADLEKTSRDRNPEDVVARLAEKTPGNAAPNVYHRDLLLGELAGYQLDLVTGRPIVPGGEAKRAADGDVGMHMAEFPEAVALRRWREHDFQEVERAAAKRWRADLAQHNPTRMIGMVKNILPTDTKISNLEQLKELVDAFCDSADPHVLELAFTVLDVPPDYRAYASERWTAAGCPTLSSFAPYATHCFKVDLVYHLGMLRGFISDARASNRADMAYLYYLPFSMIFVSGDKLHRRTVPLFARSDQSYVSHTDLKTALHDLDDYYVKLPDETKRQGVMRFASFPPVEVDNVVTRLWDQHMAADWREMAERHKSALLAPRDEEAERRTVDELNRRMREAQPLAEEEADSALAGDGPEYMVVTRQVFATKGKWQILPEETEG